MKSIEAKIWPNVEKSHGDDGCWIWKGKATRYGYGVIWVYPHRIVYELLKGPIPDRLNVLHKCDNRRCLNPAHLFLGTRADNVRDMIGKGRYKLGSRPGQTNGRAIVTPEQVHEIRTRYRPGKNQFDGNCKQLACEFGISPSAIRGIAKRKTWGTYQ